MKTTDKAADIAKAKCLLTNIHKDAQCLGLQLELLDDELRSGQEDDRIATAAGSIHRAIELMVSSLERDCQELATLMGGSLGYPPGFDSVADTLAIEATDLLSGVGVMGVILRNPDDLKFRESIDYCQISLTALLSRFLALHATTSRALAAIRRAAHEATA